MVVNEQPMINPVLPVNHQIKARLLFMAALRRCMRIRERRQATSEAWTGTQAIMRYC
eukprot:gene4743-21044_t